MLSDNPGRRAEDKACWYLRRRGWRIVARNYHAAGGELDIVASRWRTVVVVEVRYRRDGSGLQSIDGKKLARTKRVAHQMVRTHRLHQYRLQFDLMAYDQNWRLVHQRDIEGSLY